MKLLLFLWNFASEKGCNYCYIHGTLCLCPEKMWNSCYFHETLCFCLRRGATLAIFMNSAFVSEKGCDCCIH